MVLAASLVGCSASTTPPAESPETSAPELAGGSEPAPDSPPADEPPPPKPGEVVGREGPADLIPDDYSMLNGDCVELGKRLAELTRSDQATLLSPKLTAAQRAQAEKSIDDVATKIGSKWTEGCQKDLVGKTVDRKALKCASDSKTVKEFDACLNAPK